MVSPRNCGRNAVKKSMIFGLAMFTTNPRRNTSADGTAEAASSDPLDLQLAHARYAKYTAPPSWIGAIDSPSTMPPKTIADTGPTAPLVPIPPRFAFWLGLAYRFDAAPAPTPAPSPPPIAPAPAPAPAASRTVELAGRVSTAGGGKLTDLHVELVDGDTSRAITVGEDGRFTLQGKPGEELTLTATEGDTRCIVSRTVRGQTDRKPCSLELAEVLRTMAALGGQYP